jgi:hypothetical protein
MNQVGGATTFEGQADRTSSAPSESAATVFVNALDQSLAGSEAEKENNCEQRRWREFERQPHVDRRQSRKPDQRQQGGEDPSLLLVCRPHCAWRVVMRLFLSSLGAIVKTSRE